MSTPAIIIIISNPKPKANGLSSKPASEHMHIDVLADTGVTPLDAMRAGVRLLESRGCANE